MDVDECENDKNICNNNTENPDLLDKMMSVEICQSSKNLHQHVTDEFVEKFDVERRNETCNENVDSSKLNIDESVDSKNVISEAQFMPSKKRVRKKIYLASDDSDSDREILPSPVENEEKSNKNVQKSSVFSDSEESENIEINPDSNLQNTNLKQKKHRLFIDSDSEVESDIQPHEKSFTAEVDTDFSINSKNELIIANQQGHNQKSSWSSLCDDDSSEDETTTKSDQEVIENSDEGYLDEKKIKPLKYKKKSKPKNSEKEPKIMTAKEAAQLWKETKSESQRMLRESNVSLPYHKPKSFTLQEFLSKRPKLASAVPIAATTPPSVAIKMCSEQLEIIQEKMKERQKELKQFYKSESESEGDECDKDYTPPQGDKEVVEGEKGDSMKNTEVTEIVEDSQNAHLQVVDEANVADSGIDTQETVSFLLQETPIHSTDNDTVVENKEDFENNDCPEVISDIDSTSLTTEKKMDLSGDKEIIEEGGIKTVEQSSMNYDFNLDDLDDIETEQVSDRNRQKITQNKDVEDITAQVQNSNDTNDIVEEAKNLNEMKKISKLELLKEALVNIKPQLSGGPNDVIDLATGVTKPNEVTKLMERFVQHIAKRPNNTTNKVQFSVVSVDGGEIHKETVAISVEKDDPFTIEEKPGAKLAKLKDTLQNQMAQRRSELWLKKIDNRDCAEEKEVDDGEKSVCEFDDDILDDDEEEEMSESSEDEDEEEYEDTKAQSNKKSSSVFLDEEAEVSEVDDDNEDSKNDDDENNDDNEIYDDNENDDDIDKDDEEFNQDEVELDEKSKDLVNGPSTDKPTKKTLRRIIKRFTEESDDEDENNLPLDNTQIENDENVRRNCEVNLAENEDEITCHQPQNSETPIKRTSSDNKSMEFLTPISYITGIQNLSTSKLSPFRVPSVPSPLKDSNWHSDLQKKLFENSEITNSQAETMAELYSGNFQDSQELSDSQYACPPMTVSLPETGEINCSVPPSTQELLGICSGKFSGFSQVSEPVNDIDKNNMLSLSENSQRPNVEHLTFNPNSEVKSLDEDQGMIISQLLDEEEMEKFKLKLQTPTMSNTQRRIFDEFEEECAATGGVIDSDDEDTLEVKKKKRKKLYFSDDENSESERDENEEINLHDEIEDDEEEDIPVDNIGYDSEENEIELTDENSIPKLKPSDYFENEAELSESEWGSDDEDEKDLDILEAELGDKDKFDEKKLKNDLERIHMRRMLADDNKEVKLLQELLLEDGELHGTGRERQFKWKNIDSMNEDGENQVVKEDDVYLDEEESEEQWRRRRHEREMFLKEKMDKSCINDNELLGTSQLLKIGHKVIQKSQQISQGSNSGETVESNDKIDSSFVQCGFSFMSKRGSFLSRSDQVLQRLAEYNKVTTSVAIGTARNSRNFLFQTVSAPEQSSDSKVKKRKSNDGTPNVIKKLRLSDTLSPALERKMPKRPTAKAKLFGNSRTD